MESKFLQLHLLSMLKNLCKIDCTKYDTVNLIHRSLRKLLHSKSALHHFLCSNPITLTRQLKFFEQIQWQWWKHAERQYLNVLTWQYIECVEKVGSMNAMGYAWSKCMNILIKEKVRKKMRAKIRARKKIYKLNSWRSVRNANFVVEEIDFVC